MGILVLALFKESNLMFFFSDAELFQLLFPTADSHLLLKMGARSRQENCGKSNYIVHLIYYFAKFI
jgi:hypothetical protein